jgi:hypothetical protein
MLGGLLMLYQFYSGIQSALESQLAYKLEKIEQILDQAQSTGRGHAAEARSGLS